MLQKTKIISAIVLNRVAKNCIKYIFLRSPVGASWIRYAIDFIILGLSLILAYYFTFFTVHYINIFFMLSFLGLTLGVGFFKAKCSYKDLLKILLVSFENAMFNVLNLNFIKTRLIYLIFILPLLLHTFGDYIFLVLNFLLIYFI